MRRGNRYLSSLLLTAALATPVAMMAAASPQDDRNQENKQRENNKRYYDKGHKDYHKWNANEDHAYQRYRTERHQEHSFTQLNGKQRNDYWNWRHNNADYR